MKMTPHNAQPSCHCDEKMYINFCGNQCHQNSQSP